MYVITGDQLVYEPQVDHLERDAQSEQPGTQS